MANGLPIIGLQRLRRHRRPLGWLAAALIVVSLVGALGQCLTMGSMSVVDTAGTSGMLGEMPCADCTVGGDEQSLDQGTVALPGGLELTLVVALFVVSSLFALNFPKSIPIPPRPILPARSRTLKFCVLRI